MTLSNFPFEILAKLPRSWKEISTYQFIKLAHSKNINQMLSVLSDTPLHEMNQLSDAERKVLLQKIDFIFIKTGML